MLRSNETIEAAARAAPILSRPEEARLAAAWLEKGDQSAREQLFRSHLRLVLKAARRAPFKVEWDEMLNEGCLGLLTAIDRYDPSTGFRLCTYAPFWIRAQIGDHAFSSSNVVRIPATSSIRVALAKITKAKRSLEIDVDRRMGSRQIAAVAAMLGLPERSVEIADAKLCGIGSSLDAPMRTRSSANDESPATMLDTLRSKEPSPHDAVQRAERESWAAGAVADLLGCLTDREKDVFIHRTLDRDMTLEDLASVYGVSRERIRQIEVIANRKVETRASAMRALALAHLRHVDEDVAA